MLPAGFIPGWIQRALEEAHKKGEDLTPENIEPRLEEIIKYDYIDDPEMNEYCYAGQAKEKALRYVKGRDGTRIINGFKEKVDREQEEARQAELKAEQERIAAEEAAREREEKEEAIMKELETDQRMKEAAEHAEFHKDPEDGDHWMERSASFPGKRI